MLALPPLSALYESAIYTGEGLESFKIYFGGFQEQKEILKN
jgi:hypothetical protein